MRRISYFLTGLTSLLLVILLSLLPSCNHPQSATPADQAEVTTHHLQNQLNQSVSQPLEPQKVSAQSSNTTVKILNFKYEPANLNVVVGASVQFINQDEEPHTVTANDSSFNSKALDTNETWTYTFTKPGTFPYFCAIHPYMKGTITVTPKRN